MEAYNEGESYLKKRMNNILAGRPRPPKKQYSIPKKSKKLIEKEREEKEKRGGGDTELQKFFKNCMKRMSGVCSETGLKTETHIYQYAIMSICHILPKRLCPSVATNPLNWIELIPDKHHLWDNISWDERATWGNWPKVRERLVMIYDDLAEDELRHFPDIVLQWMKDHDSFYQER